MHSNEVLRRLVAKISPIFQSHVAGTLLSTSFQKWMETNQIMLMQKRVTIGILF